MTEFGIFNDEGQLERDFYSREEAVAAIAERYAEEDDLVVLECCHDHPDQPREGCEECPADDAEDDEPEDDDE